MYIACEDANFDWTDEEVRLVDELYKSGEGIKAISKRVGRPLEELLFLLVDRSHKNKLDFKFEKIALEKPKEEVIKDPPITKELYLELKKSGVTDPDIKKHLRIGSNQFWEMKKRWALLADSRYPTQEEYEELRQKGLSNREVSQMYRMGEKTLYNLKKTWEVTCQKTLESI